MKTIVFDGRKRAAEKEISLSNRVLGLKARGVYPKLASILIGSDPASRLYVNLKKKAAERIGAELDIYLLKENSKLEEIITLIDSLNNDDTVQGIMVQMPLPADLQKHKTEIVRTILADKDVDGMRSDSEFLHPTSKAVIEIIKKAQEDLGKKKTVCVVGATGMVGVSLVKQLKSDGFTVLGANRKDVDLERKTSEANILVSATGHPGLITGKMVQHGVVVIDVGSPKGDIDFESVSPKASFITPVPGGVGPLTISCLLEHLILAC